MRVVGLVALYCVSYLPGSTIAAEPDLESLVKQVITAAGGEDKLLKLFRTRETVNISTDPEKKVSEPRTIRECDGCAVTHGSLEKRLQP